VASSILKDRCDGLLDDARPGRTRTIDDDRVATVIERTLRTQAGSIRCIRMRNRDIVELFEKVPPYAPVEIRARLGLTLSVIRASHPRT